MLEHETRMSLSCRSKFIRDKRLKDMKPIAAEAAPAAPAAVDVDVDYAGHLYVDG
jgi:hypothetical protein